MATVTNVDLRKARDEKDLTREQLAALVHVSASTIENWERGISTPGPDDVDSIARALNHPTLWHDWMMSNFTSYARRYQEITPYALPSAIMSARHELGDVLALQDQVERDAIDGKIDDPQLKARYKKETREAMSALLRAMQAMEDGE